MREISIDTPMGQLGATLFQGTTQKLFIIASATGVKQHFYFKFAESLNDQGYSVLTFDYCGIERSLNTPIAQCPCKLIHWGANDLEAVLQYAFSQFPNSEIHLIGHSIGGQIIGLAPSARRAITITLVASQSGYWKHWQGLTRYRMWGNWHFLFPLLTQLFGYLPSKKITGMENLPKGVALEWKRWGRNPDYLFGALPKDQIYHGQIEAKLLSISIEGDRLAPKGSVDWLTEKYAKAHQQRMHLWHNEVRGHKLGHFNIFKQPYLKEIWPTILKKLTV